MQTNEVKRFMGVMFKFHNERINYNVIPSDYLLTIELKFPMFLCVNCCSHEKPGIHWLGIVVPRPRSKVIFFDSYGQDITTYGPNFVKFLHRVEEKAVEQRHVRVQEYGTDTCGQFVLYFLCKIYCGESLSAFYSTLSTSNQWKNELLVKQFVDVKRNLLRHCCVDKS